MSIGKSAILKIASFTIGISGVFATFSYANSPAKSGQNQIHISVFEWVGEGILPDAMGTDHKELINTLIVGEAGLNEENSYLNQQITARKENTIPILGISNPKDTFGSSDFWQNANVSDKFNADTYNLSFLMYFPNPFSDSDNDGKDDIDESETTQYIFTTSVNLGTSSSWGVSAHPNIPLGEYVYPVYRTTVVNRYGDWVATTTELGCAKSAYYDNSLAGANLQQTPSFDPSSWLRTDDPTLTPPIGSKENAIYTYVHTTIDDKASSAGVPSIDGYETSTHVSNEPTDTVYYRHVCEKSTEYTLAFIDERAVATVYDISENVVEYAVTTDNGIKRFTWTATAGETYVIGVSGVSVMYFTLYN